MITFKQFLAEAETAGVYVKGPLNVISSMIKDHFSLNWSKLSMTCLANQFIYSLEAASDISAQLLVDAGEKRLSRKQRISSASFEMLFNAYNNKPLKLKDGRTVTFQLSSHKFTVDEAIEHVKQGIPVVVVVNSDAGDWEGYDYTTHSARNKDFEKDGKVPAEHIKRYPLNRTGYYHALLMVGYDAQSKELICRESRSTYGFKGYLKIPKQAMTDEHARFLGTLVDSYKITGKAKSESDAKSYDFEHYD